MLIRQIFRNPTKMTACILIFAISVAALCISIGQYSAALAAGRSVNDLYTTIALPVPQAQTVQISTDGMLFQYTSKLLTWEQQKTIETLLEENPALVKTVSYTGLASAYIPQLQPDLYTNHHYNYGYGVSYGLHPETAGAPYSCAVLEIELEEVSDRVCNFLDLYRNGYCHPNKTKQWYEELNGYYAVVLTGKIKTAVALESDYPDPTDYTAKLVLLLPGAEALEAIQLQVGQRYLVYGMDYYDLDWYDSISTVKNQFCHRTVSMTLKDYSALQNMGQQYSVPTITRLEESAADFLGSVQGQAWKQVLQNVHINNQCFPILGVDDLMYIADFARQTAQISQGRDFTLEERSSGAKVCILSQSLAQANGITVGDRITLQYYGDDLDDPYQSFLMENEMAAGIQSPAAAYYTATTPFVNEGEHYTVVGLYRNDGWADAGNNLYSFTPNTVFVPKSSVSGRMDWADQGMFRTIVLENGSIPAFRTAAEAAGDADLFVYYDQGYSEIREKQGDFQLAAQRYLLAGMALAGIMLLTCLLLLLPARKRTLGIMTDLGVPVSKKLGYIFSDTAALLLPGTGLGLGVSVILCRQVSEKLIGAWAAVSVPQAGVFAMAAGGASVFVLAIFFAVTMTLPWIWGKTPERKK